MRRPFKHSWNHAANIKKREKSKDEKRESEQHQKYVDSINAITDQLATNQQQNDTNERKRALRDKLTIILVFATVVAAGIGDWFFYGQMQEMQRAYGPIKESADAAKTSADAALKQAQESHEQTVTIRAQVRANISAQNFQVDEYFQNGVLAG
jgi:hypothetical protein